MDGWTDGRTDERTENLPVLQDFVPYRGRCPKRRRKKKREKMKKKKKQQKDEAKYRNSI